MSTKIGPETSQVTEDQVVLAEKISGHVQEQMPYPWNSLSPLYQRIILIAAVVLIALIVITPTAVAISNRSRTEKSGNNVISNKSKEVQPGAKPTKQKVFVSLCGPNSCRNNARCISGNNDYACKCKNGYYGDRCEKRNNLCSSNPCKNNGRCVSANNDYACNCQDGYYGGNCDKTDNPCDSNPCGNNGVCFRGNNNYTCSCQSGYHGNNCSDKIQPDPSGTYIPGNDYEYIVITEPQNWHISRIFCNMLGADLAYHGMEVLSLRRAIGNNVVMDNETWIGLNDIVTEGRYLWVDGSVAPSDHIHWAPNQPNNISNLERCVYLSKSQNYSAIDTRCSDLKPALCEKRII